jgi:ATP-dependent exoDNAse (exonuclease V) alpha subunit
MGAIHEITDDNERVKKIATDYVQSTHGKNAKQTPKEVLVVSPTHAEGERVTEQIRQDLKERKIIGTEEKKFQTLKNVQLTAAEKQKTENYTKGNWIIFQQNAKGFKTGSRYEITGTEKNNVLVKDNTGKARAISTANAPRYNVFEPKQTGLAKGDKIRITGNGHALDGKSLFNGTMYNIAGFDKQGNIKLSNGSAISKDYGQFALGYVMTSHASQGKTVDKVIISQSSMSFRASSKEQFYVSVSRGRQAVSIYTDGKADLLQAVKQSGQRLSARELTKKEKLVANGVEINRLKFFNQVKERAMKFIRKEIDKIKGNGLQRSITAKETGRRK